MRLPIEMSNPASVIALAGIMRRLGVRARFVGPYAGAEIDRDITAADLARAAQSAHRFLGAWPDDVDSAWWMAQIRQARQDRDLQALAALAALGSEGPDGWKPSRFRLVGGPQRWLKMFRDAALAAADEESAARWLAARDWPRDTEMGMTGLDSGAFAPAALRWAGSDTQQGSLGNPISLWLMWEGIQALPSHGGETTGWVSDREFRWPVWRDHIGIESLVSIWRKPTGEVWAAEKYRSPAKYWRLGVGRQIA
jgi:hypothetical protein